MDALKTPLKVISGSSLCIVAAYLAIVVFSTIIGNSTIDNIEEKMTLAGNFFYFIDYLFAVLVGLLFVVAGLSIFDTLETDDSSKHY